MEIKFFMPMEPPTATAQERKAKIVGGRVMFYQPKRLKEAKELLRANLMPHAPIVPLEGPLMLDVAWCFKAKSHKPDTWRSTKPDTDNLQKMLKDVMTACGYWKDDAQVCCEAVTKIWSETAGIGICIKTLDGIRPGVSADIDFWKGANAK